MKVYFNEKLVGDCKDVESLDNMIADFLKKKNIISYYQRYVGLDNGKTMIDYGSWSNFFFIDCDIETLLKHEQTRDLPTHQK